MSWFLRLGFTRFGPVFSASAATPLSCSFPPRPKPSAQFEPGSTGRDIGSDQWPARVLMSDAFVRRAAPPPPPQPPRSSDPPAATEPLSCGEMCEHQEASIKLDCSRLDCFKLDCSKQDCSKQDCSKQDCSRQDCSKQDCSRQDCSKQDCSRLDCFKLDCSRQDCSRQDCSKQDCLKLDCSKLDCESKLLTLVFPEGHAPSDRKWILRQNRSDRSGEGTDGEEDYCIIRDRSKTTRGRRTERESGKVCSHETS
uniref:Uncharacterized protein n=1 Tax=Knipowitschia caucasica TaxID=637954 RepID=A0AAV2LS76_KNICA